MSYVLYYADQIREHIPDLETAQPQAFDHLEEANKVLVTEYNERIKRETPEDDFIPLYAPSADSWSRRMSEELINVLYDLGHNLGLARCRKFPGLVSYNQNDKTVNVLLTERDFLHFKPQRMRMGKYLRRCGYSEDYVNRVANEFTSMLRLIDDAVLDIAKGEDIVEIYENGPNSCMSGCASGFEGGIHPASVYDSPDVACAYCHVGGRIVARAMLNLIDQTYSTIYGNEQMLKPLLEKAGYESGDLDGCRIRRIESDLHGAYVMPYIDGADEVAAIRNDPNYFIIGGSGVEYHRCTNTNGLSMEGVECPCCGDLFDPEYDGIYIESCEQTYCSEGCAESDNFVYISGYGDWVHESDAIYLDSRDEYFHAGCDEIVTVDDEFEHVDDCVYSDEQGEYIREDEAVYIDSIESYVDADRESEFEEEDDYEAA